MAIRDLVPWRRGDGLLGRSAVRHPLAELRNEMNRLFDGFFQGTEWPLGRLDDMGEFAPSVDVRETDKAFLISAELPGMDEKDIQVEYRDDGIAIRGEKKTDKEEKKEGYQYSERSYGSFYRLVPIPAEVQVGKASAEFSKGVLTVTLPKSPEAQAKRKKIEIKRG